MRPSWFQPSQARISLPSANSIQMRPWIWILRFVGGRTEAALAGHPFCLCRLAPPTRQARKLVRGMGMGAETLCHNPSRVFHPGLGIRPEYLVFEMG